ncbi:hypothetical protein M422DRAFT_785026 [Sphaerobolus stellatus SS14]|uniref:Uncharacterized protein n=1 Tax=Sphaerobolus stellatus (strain SS14) TaxID=990650 RepID=A0A0C9UD90_SPHS4|nr:hypothetical protein M422DRAFT_785026 [Sphaerobolus stellatus SS14]
MQSVANIATSAVGLSIVVLHHAWLYPQELAIYRRRRSKITPGISSIAFILLRYAGLLALITSLLFATLKTEHCRSLLTANQVATILTITCSGLLFLFSAIRRWQGNYVISGILGTLYLGMIACSCVTAVQFRTLKTPLNDHLSCQLLPLTSLAALGYGASLFLGLAILVCLFAKQPKHSAAQRSNYMVIACVGLASAANLAWLVIYSLGKHTEGAKLTSAPFGVVTLVLTGVQAALMAHEEEPVLPIVSPLNSLSSLQVGRSPTIFVSPPTPSAKTYNVNFSVGNRPETPFSSYGYDSDGDDIPANLKEIKGAYITREVVVTVE